MPLDIEILSKKIEEVEKKVDKVDGKLTSLTKSLISIVLGGVIAFVTLKFKL